MQRNSLIMLVFTVGMINATIRPIREHVNEFGLLESLIAGFGISFIVWFAIYCAFDLLQKSERMMASPADISAAFAALFFLMIPSTFMSWIVLAFFSGYGALYIFSNAGAGRNACFIMLAVALRIPVSDICLKLSADILLQFDALATVSLLHLIDPSIMRQGNIIIGPAGHELLIMTGCASFTNISLALLLWFTIIRTHIMKWRRALTLYVLPLTALVMAINIARLSLMARSQEAYFYYHDGLGADIINALMTVAALSIALLCLYHEKMMRKAGAHGV